VNNNGEKMPPMIIFNGNGKTLSKKLKTNSSIFWFNGRENTSYNN
jgi:hypothetical protein